MHLGKLPTYIRAMRFQFGEGTPPFGNFLVQGG